MSATTNGSSGTQTIAPRSLHGASHASLEDILPRARRLMAESLGIDSHIDTVQRVLVMGEDLGQRHDVGHVDLPRLRESEMHAPFFALWVPVFFRGAEAVFEISLAVASDSLDVMVLLRAH